MSRSAGYARMETVFAMYTVCTHKFINIAISRNSCEAEVIYTGLSDTIADKFIGIVLFFTIVGALIGTVILSFNQVSASSVTLAVTIGVLANLLLGIFILKVTMKMLKG